MTPYTYTPTSTGRLRLRMTDGLGHTMTKRVHTHAHAMYVVRDLARQQGLRTEVVTDEGAVAYLQGHGWCLRLDKGSLVDTHA